MSQYTGEKCLVCGNKFKETDDIVVCPDCGTPYHRNCYVESGRCINDELHKSGGSWVQEREKEKRLNGNDKEIICRYCGYSNRQNSRYCSNCGMSISESETNNNESINIGNMKFALPDKYCGYNPNDTIEGVTIAELADFIGDNTYYYLPIFKKMNDTGRKWSFNLSSLFFPDYYFANRKMYSYWILSFIYFFIISFPSTLISLSNYFEITNLIPGININSDNFATFTFICDALMYGFKIIMGFFGNWFYFRHAINKIKSIKLQEYVTGNVKSEIKSAGGIDFKNVLINFILKIVFLAFIVILLL